MSIYKSSINKPITTIMVFVAILVAGLYCVSLLPIDQYPEMEPPYVTVMTTYSGANAEEIETNVTKRLEDAFNSVQGMKEITSTSKDNMSMVMMEFDWGTELDVAVNDVRDAIDMIYDYLPDGCSRPAIFKLSTSMMPIMMYTVTANESYTGLDKLLEEKVANPLKRVDGIGSISVVGAPERFVYINVDPKKLDATGMTMEQVTGAIAANNMDMPSGSMKIGKESYQVRVEGEFNESDEINDIVIGTFNGASVFVKDVAQVNDTIKDISLIERANRDKSVKLMVSRQSGANSVNVCKEVKSNLEELRKGLPSDVKFNMVYDSSEFIGSAIGNLSETLLLALIFVVIVVLLFIGRWRATAIIALTIPVSLLVAAIYLFATGSTLNIISLSSLSIAIGLVVDDAIVVLENITKHIKRGSSPREAAIYATNEVWVSVLVSTLVIVAVFLPLTMINGMMGVMFKELGWIVTITVVTSMVAAISLTPMLSSKLLKAKEDEKETWYDRTIGKKLDGFENWYERILRWALRHKKTVIFTSLAIFVSSMFLFKFIGTDFMPSADQSRLTAAIQVQSGTRVEETMKTTKVIEEYIFANIPEVTLLSSSTGSNDASSISAMFTESGTNMINLTMKLKPIKERKRTDVQISEQIRNYILSLPEVINSAVTTGGNGFMGGTSTVDVEIYGYDFDKTNALASVIKQKVSKIPGARDVAVSRKDDKAELKIVLNKEKLALHNLNSTTVSTYVRNRINGATVGYFKENGDEFDIVVRNAENFRNSISDVEDITIPTQTGKVKLKELGEVKELWTPPNIEHKRRERLVKISVTPVGVPLGTMAESMKAELKDVDIPSGVMMHIGGTYEDQQESFANIGLLLLAVIVLVYIVMASQFESFSKPFVIMFSIPFAFTGVALGLFLTGTSLSMIAAIGVVMLVGIVVKNGVVLVDFINLMRDRGYEVNDAVALAGKSRLKPVIMTALTAILGMLPLALGIGEGSETWAPLGVTIVGGLTISTIVTMILIPVLYSIFARHGERDKQSEVRKHFIFMDK
jgi:HAE1 family hydrophobic/amphiphilic exporter-1